MLECVLLLCAKCLMKCVCVYAGEVGGTGADAEAGKRRELAEQAGHSA